MTVDEVRAVLAEHREELDGYQVEALSVFGSVARSEARPDSDVDVLVDLRKPIGLIKLAGLQLALGDWLGRPVDIVTRAGIHPALRDRILGEAVLACRLAVE